MARRGRHVGTYKLDSPPGSHSQTLALIFRAVRDALGERQTEQIALEREREIAHRVGRLGVAEVVERVLRGEDERVRERRESRGVPGVVMDRQQSRLATMHPWR